MHILMLNDRAVFNARYRAHLMDYLRKRGHQLESCGVFDSPVALCLLVCRLLFNKRSLILASNLRTNVVALLFARGPKLIILNGLGRFRRSWKLRLIIRLLLQLRPKARIVVQNYADYRYLRRHCFNAHLKWLPGSGGVSKPSGDDRTLVVVQRDEKIASVSADIVLLISGIQTSRPLVIVGCENSSQLKNLFSAIEFRSVGYVAGNDIFREGGVFVQPRGYGEGFPHTLADALVSGLQIYISDIEFLRYGLSQLGATRVPLAPGWSRLMSREDLLRAVSAETISREIMSVCEDLHEEMR